VQSTVCSNLCPSWKLVNILNTSSCLWHAKFSLPLNVCISCTSWQAVACSLFNNNNNNNNNNARTMFMVLSSWPIATARVHPVHLPGRQPSDQANRLGRWVRLYRLLYDLYPPSPFIITQPEGWYWFYHPTEGGRLSHPRHTACSPI